MRKYGDGIKKAFGDALLGILAGMLIWASLGLITTARLSRLVPALNDVCIYDTHATSIAAMVLSTAAVFVLHHRRHPIYTKATEWLTGPSWRRTIEEFLRAHRGHIHKITVWERGVTVECTTCGKKVHADVRLSPDELEYLCNACGYVLLPA